VSFAAGQETCPTAAGLGPRGSRLETSDVVPEPECITALRRAHEQLWRVDRRSHASFAPASTDESSSKARLHPLSLDHLASPDRSRTLRDGRETRSVDVSNPHRLIFSKTSTHVSCSYPHLRTDDACGSRRLHRFGGSNSAPDALSSILGVTPRGASTRTFSFRVARAVPIL